MSGPRSRARWCLAALLAAAAPAHSFDSRCYVYADLTRDPSYYSSLPGPAPAECAPGPASVRNRWIAPTVPVGGPGDEHRQIVVRALQDARVPEVFNRTFQLRVFTDRSPVLVGPFDVMESIRPVYPWDRALRVYTRPISAAELAQIPDFAYGLWDWASGAEDCPLPGGLRGTSPQECHDFASHMGAVNSNHFVPQTRSFYGYYHALALARGRDCGAMLTALGPDASRFQDFTQECEFEALALESIAQHFLGDAWSMGHMWERWGSANLEEFPSSSFGDPPRVVAALAAATAGIIHGARGLLQARVTISGVSALNINDALCAPVDTLRFIRVGFLGVPTPDLRYLSLGSPRFLHDGTTTGAGFGDLYLGLRSNPTYDRQSTRLAECAAAGVASVYGAIHSDYVPPAGVGVRDPTGGECHGQRAINASMYLGMGLNFALPGGFEVMLPLDGALVPALIPVASAIAGVDLTPSPPLVAQFVLAVNRMAFMARIRTLDQPNGTELAQGGLGDFLGVRPNSGYVREPPPAVSTGGPAPTPVATYADPQLPWPGDSARAPTDLARARALAAVFHRAHAADWCRQMTVTDLRALQAHASDGTLDAEAHDVACEVCTEFTLRHLQTTFPGSPGERPLCDYLLAPSERTTDRFVTLAVPGTSDRRTLVRRWCGCSTETLFLTQQGVGRVQLGSGRVTRLPVRGEALGLVRAGTFPWDMDVTARGTLRAVVSNHEGTLSILAMDRGREYELDTDLDPGTTTPGAPPGVTRIALGRGTPGEVVTARGVEVTPDGRFALVALAGLDELVTVDLDNYTLCRRVSLGPGTCGPTAGASFPMDVAVSHDGTRAYVSLAGVAAAPGNQVVRIAVAEATRCGASTGAVVSSCIPLPPGAGPQTLALSEDGRSLAVAGVASNHTWVLNTATETVTIDAGDAAGAGPTALAFRHDGSAFFVGNQSDLAGDPLRFPATVWGTFPGLFGLPRPIGIDRPVHAFAVSNDDRWLYVGDQGGGISVLPIDPPSAFQRLAAMRVTPVFRLPAPPAGMTARIRVFVDL